MQKADILPRAAAFEGDIGIYTQNLSTGETLMHAPDAPLVAASVIKLGIMLAAFDRFHAGVLDPDERINIQAEQKMPSCGVLNALGEGMSVSWMDLTTLMIIVSDNTATNLLIDRLGIEQINQTLNRYGLSSFQLRRKLFDEARAALGIQNTITARGVGAFFERLYARALVSPASSDEMLRILLMQRLNGKLPFYLSPLGIRVAHKTGEDTRTTHDAGILLSNQPIIAVFLSNDVCVPAYERFMQDAALALVTDTQG